MTSFKKTRDAIVLAYDDGFIDDEEFLLLYDAHFSKNPEFPYEEYGRFDLDEMDDVECKAEFRFNKSDIRVLAYEMGIPDKFVCHQGTAADGIEGLCMVLKRFCYPCRYSDLILRFGRSVPELSMICNAVVDEIYNSHHQRITQWNNAMLNPVKLQEYADAIYAKGAALNNCFGFIDGTVRPICRPGELQRLVYNGHKRIHALKFQSIALPNGIIGHMFGPVEGRKHDSSMLADSGLLGELQQYAFSPTGQAMCVYGDPAYPLRVHLQAPFRIGVITQPMKDFNKSMSAVRVSVEWLFWDIVSYFKFLDFKKNLKLGLQPIGKMYIVCAILRNALSCFYGNNTAEFFELDPPTIQEYFN